jgi:hypothetical protein
VSAVDALLAKLRRALDRDDAAPPPPVPAVPAELRPSGPDDTLDLVARFTAAARRQGTEVLDDPGALAPLLERHGPVHRLGTAAPSAPFELGCTIARARLGVALSGSVLIDHAGGDTDALCAMTPPLLVVELDPARIVPTLADALATLGDDAPPTRVLVTGPSKTADIEGILVTGVHGPGRVVIALDRAVHAV